MKIKKILTILALCLMTIQFNMTSCSSATDSEDPIGEAFVNDPTNDYQVVAQVISVGGLGGCTIGTVAHTEEIVENADFKINDVTLIHQYPVYTDTLFQLSFFPGSNYSLNISHNGVTIATGTAIMPSTPVISNASSIQNHDLNSSLTVNWQSLKNAHSVQLSIAGEFYDPFTQISVERGYASPLLTPETTSHTIPDTLFSFPGEYSLGIIAYYGVNPGFDIDNLEDNGYIQSYNMEGAAGVFMAVSMSSAEGETITVGNPSLTKTVKKNRLSFKDYIIKKHKKWFGNQIILQQK